MAPPYPLGAMGNTFSPFRSSPTEANDTPTVQENGASAETLEDNDASSSRGDPQPHDGGLPHWLQTQYDQRLQSTSRKRSKGQPYRLRRALQKQRNTAARLRLTSPSADMPSEPGGIPSSDSDDDGAPMRPGLRSSSGSPSREAVLFPHTVPSSSPPVPLASRLLTSSRIPSYARANLERLAAAVLHEKLVAKPESLAILSPMCNFPRIELLFNTKLSMQFSRTMPEACREPQLCQRLCEGCWDGERARGAHCAEGADCVGCKRCVGRKFVCPARDRRSNDGPVSRKQAAELPRSILGRRHVPSSSNGAGCTRVAAGRARLDATCGCRA